MSRARPVVTPAELSGLVPLDSLSAEGLAHLAGEATWMHRGANEFLFRAGESVPQAHFLVEGAIELRSPGTDAGRRIVAGSEAARHRIPVPAVAGLDALCLGTVRCLAIDRQLLDTVLTWEQDHDATNDDGSAAAGGDDWMMRLLQTPAFLQVPPMNLQAMFMRMQALEAQAGETIVRQDAPGDYFYVLTEGRCIVTRNQPSGKALQLAQLEAGSCFGEEALISDAPRNATVTMLTRGTLRRLSKQDFRTLLHEPLTRRMTFEEASARVDQGQATFVDVRLPSEFSRRHLPGSVNLPLYLLRMRTGLLDAGRCQVCVCDTGRRSAVASYLLVQRGFDACMLADGLPSQLTQ